ncbi:MAG: hypothetical protein ACRDTG_11540 [Pseudonocardiaceae bacterium]
MSSDPQTGDSVEDFDAWAAEQDWTGDVLLRDTTPEQLVHVWQFLRSQLTSIAEARAERRRQAAEKASLLKVLPAASRHKLEVPLRCCRCGRVLLRVYRFSRGALAVPAGRGIWLAPGEIAMSDDGRPQLVQRAGWHRPYPWWVEDERADKHRVRCHCSTAPVAVERMRRPRRGIENRERREMLG